MVIDDCASRGSSAEASTVATLASASGVRRDGSARVVGQGKAECRQHPGAAVVGAAAAQADEKTPDAGVEQCADQLTDAARRPRADRDPHPCRIGDADDLRDFDDGGLSVAPIEHPICGVVRRAARTGDGVIAVPSAPTAASTASSVPSPPSAIGHARMSASGHTRREPARDGRADRRARRASP